jgi:nucleotide-binding universal stress UspA family protein
VEEIRDRVRLHMEEVLAAAVNFARWRGVRLTPLLREGHPADTILTCAEEAGADLVVLGARDRTASPGLGGTADRVSDHSPCAVLLVK